MKTNLEIKSMPGFEIQQALMKLDTTFGIVAINYDVLVRLENKLLTDDSLLPLQNREQLNTILLNVLAFLQNYLAAIKALVDHSRVEVEKLGNSQLSIEYKLKTKVFISDMGFKFLQELRNYALHQASPVIGHQVCVDRNSQETKTVTVSTGELIHSGWDWTKSVFEFINSQAEEIQIMPIVKKYQLGIQELNKWLFDKVHELYATELNDLYSEVEEQRKLVDKLLQVSNKESAKSSLATDYH